MTLMRGQNSGHFLWDVFVGEAGGWVYTGPTPRDLEVEVWPIDGQLVALLRGPNGEVLAEQRVTGAPTEAIAPTLLALGAGA